MNPTVGFPLLKTPLPAMSGASPAAPSPAWQHRLGCPSMCHGGRSRGDSGCQQGVVFPGVGNCGGSKLQDRWVFQRKTQECEDFSSDMWWLFDPERGQLSRQRRV